MAAGPGIVGQLILSKAPVPATAVDALADRFGRQFAQNQNLTPSQRIAWLTERRTDAATAQALCASTFTNGEIEQVLAVESRKGSVRALADHNPRPDALRLILAHPRGSAAASKLIGNASFDQVELLEHFDALHQLERVELLLRCDLRVSDAAIAAHLTRVGGQYDRYPSTRHKAAKFIEFLDSLVCYRPGLTAELARVGYPLVCRPSIAASPWVTETDVESLLALDAPHRTEVTADTEMALAQNPWVDPHGVVADGLLNEASRKALERRSVHVRTSPFELTGDDLRAAWMYGLPAANRRRLPQLMAVLAGHPNLGGYADDVAARLEFLQANLAVVPSWVLAATVTRFSERYPGRLKELFVEHCVRFAPAPTVGYRYATSRVGPANAVESERVYLSRELFALPAENDWLLRDALARFAVDLGYDGDAWTSAVTLADGVRGSLAELAGVSTVTVAAAA